MSAGAYLAAAYVFVVVTVVAWIGIVALKLGRLQRAVADLIARGAEDGRLP